MLNNKTNRQIKKDRQTRKRNQFPKTTYKVKPLIVEDEQKTETYILYHINYSLQGYIIEL